MFAVLDFVQKCVSPIDIYHFLFFRMGSVKV